MLPASRTIHPRGALSGSQGTAALDRLRAEMTDLMRLMPGLAPAESVARQQPPGATCPLASRRGAAFTAVSGPGADVDLFDDVPV